MDDERVFELEPGDFLYQTDRERFLVVMEERDGSYLFAVHGWREMGKERVTDYVENEHGSLHTQDQFEGVVESSGDEDVKENYERLKELFAQYEDSYESDVVEQFAVDDQ